MSESKVDLLARDARAKLDLHRLSQDYVGPMTVMPEDVLALCEGADALKRLADPTEMAGMGVTEEMTGPAAAELRTRMLFAGRALAKIEGYRPCKVDTRERCSSPDYCAEHGCQL